MVETVAVIGAGTIGASWTSYFLAQGCDVRVWDPAAGFSERTAAFVARVWPILEQLGFSAEASPDRAVYCETLAEALSGATFVQESGPEDAAVKTELIAEIDKHLPPEVVISSSSTALPTSEFQGGAAHPERVVLGHPFNPPHLMPLVEVGGGKKTDVWAVDRAMAFYEGVGKSPVRLRAEIPGHLANRLQAAVYREAVHLVAEGYATVADIDKAMAGGPGLRWAFMGPHMTYHLGGGAGGIAHYFDILGASQERRWAALGEPELTDEVKQKIIAGVAEEAAGRTIDELAAARDETLLNLLKALGKSPS
ncbi:MAG: carnitine 3-dehydrogenase [Alphaproteobacteria bacterium]|jgi:carnitine 3-dehydrogenase